MPPTPTTDEIAMTERAERLHSTATGQIEQLSALVASIDQAALRLPCPGREKLGDGTVGALVSHTADNYQRIAGFVQTSDRMSAEHNPTEHDAHRMPRSIRARGHGPAQHADHAPGAGEHDNGYSADNIDPSAVIAQLSVSCDGLGRLAELTDSQLDAIPPNDSFRFCDGQRTLEQVLTSLLTHQSHQLQTLQTTLN
jgi:hypothetical protein